MGSVTLANIRKSVGSVEVLHGLDLEAKDREFVVLVGPSGCGKSTMLRAFAGHETIISGKIKLANAKRAEIERRVREAAEILGLTPLLDRYARQLSGRQRQRVAIGRAIVRDKAVFLFDEPLSNLGAKLRVQMRAEIKELH